MSLSCDYTYYLTSIYDLVESVPRDNMGDSLLFDLVEVVLRGLRVENEEQASFVLLPIWTCQAVGGQPQQAVAVSAAWCLLHTAALLLDDVQDHELALKPWPPIGPSQAINLATALIFASQLALSRLEPGADTALILAIWQVFSRAILNVCAGQHLDLCAESLSLDDYWRMAGSKSGAFFELACRTGAMLGTEDGRLIDRYAEFGYNLGILVQISDDFNGAWNAPNAGDLVAGSQALPVVYALSVGSDRDRVRLLNLLERTSSEAAAITSARQLISDLGGLHYLSIQAEAYRRRARTALPTPETTCAAYSQLTGLLDNVMPVLDVGA